VDVELGIYAIDVHTPLAYIAAVIFVETPSFTKQVQELLSDDDYAAFQRLLAEDPALGDLIEGTGGLRKARVAAKGKGKRGGARVIYYWFTSASQIGMLAIFAKGELEDLSADQRAKLRAVVEKWR